MDYLPPGWRHSDEAIRERDLERLRRESTAITSLTKQQEQLKKAIADFQDKQQRMDDHGQNRELLRKLLANQGFPNPDRGYSGWLGPGNLRRRNAYTGDEIGRQIERERHGGYPDSLRNCLCDGGCDDCCHHWRRKSCSRSSSRRRYSSNPQQVNVIGPVYMDGCEPESIIKCYDWDFPPRSPAVDIYKKRWCGLLPDKRLPWMDDHTVLDGNNLFRLSRHGRRRYPFYYY